MDDVEILRCADVDGWDRWLAAHGTSRSAVWLAIARKGSGTATLTATEAGDVAICHGWIDSTRRRLDATHFLQRYSPRRPGSPWSRVNIERVAALEAAGRMRPAGLAQVVAAQADGRWATAYAPQRTAAVPDDLAAALAANDRARAAYQALGRSDRYAVFLPLLKAHTSTARAGALRRALAGLEAAGGPAR
ncbi:OmdA domain containing protein [Micromonospora craterilacus]|uniref:OmdA domain containing protein n=1 Tax=Micromonospora craterilacus TaxID=1655439 RepID=A0A2W2EVV6_9ACTN|nr:YdeI/OmpD-associated family protein [Micromonospora craterilacus]PZG17690.1 OmdA domain containing protein [Micromonospora craterilacus]